MNTTAPAGVDSPRFDTERVPSRDATQEAWTLQAVARAKQGDRSAVRYLYAKHSTAVRLYAASLMRDADAVDDVVQTTFLKLITSIHRYEPREVPFEAWLLRVARNVAYDELRRRRARESVPFLDHDAAEVPAEAWDGGELEEALERMPAAWREVLVLRHVVGLTPAEIGERLDLDRRAVGTLMERARARLQAELGAPASAAAPGEPRLRAADRPLVQRLG